MTTDTAKFELDYQETSLLEYARHPFDMLLTYETWLENKALISKSFIKKKKSWNNFNQTAKRFVYWSTVDLMQTAKGFW